MRNLKKLLAVIVAVCILATMSFTAFAADATKTDAQIATDLGVIQGSGNGVTADYLATQPDRLQGAIMFLRLKGLESAAIAFTGTENFADVAGLNDTNTAILAYLNAHPELGYEGIGDNKFDPLTKMTAKQYYKVLLVALGYSYDSTGTDATKDFNWSTVLQFAASKGLTKLMDNEKFTINDLAIGTVEALKATLKDGSTTLLGALVESKAIAADKAAASGLTATPTALSVVSATADNLKVAKFVFSKELDSSTVVAANFTVGGVAVDSAILQDDKKTVSVVMSTAQPQNGSADIVVKSVKGTDGTTIADTTKTVTFIDTTVPTISGAVAKNAKAIVLTASEPINEINQYVKVFSDIKVDGNSVVATSSFDYAKNTLTLHLASALTVGTHKLDVASLKDYAGYVAVATTSNIDVAADTTAPTIASAEVLSNNQIKVTFSEEVDHLYQGSFTVNGYTATAVQDTNDLSVFTLTLSRALDIGATVEIKVTYQDQRDVVGNIAPSSTYTFKVSDDTSLPTVTATVGSANAITLDFSKPMTENVGTITVYNVSDGAKLGGVISFTQLTWNSTTEAVIPSGLGGTGLGTTDAKDIKLVISGAKDASIRTNLMPDTTITVKAIDSNVPTLLGSYTVAANVATDASDDTITFYFSEAMDSATLNNLANYVVTTAGTLGYTGPLTGYTSGASISSIASDAKSVTLKVNGIAAASGVGFTVYAIKDIAGNMLAPTTVALANPVGPQINDAYATAGNTIVVDFDQPIGYFAPGAFYLTQDGTKTGTFTAAVYNGSISGNTVTLTLDRDLGTTTAGAMLYVNDASLVKNVYGTNLTGAALIGGTPVADQIKPTVSVSTSGSGIIVTFSENVVASTASAICSEIGLSQGGVASSVTPGMITYKDASFNDITVADNAVIRQVYIQLAANTTYKILVYPRSTVDLHGNFFTYMPETSVTTGY